mgnify:FL=1
MQRTLSIVKPDGVNKNLIGEVIRRFEKTGIRLIALKMMHITKKQAEGFYAVHRQRPFFDSLTTFMCSGPIVPMVLEENDAIKKVRDIMGTTNPKDAAPGTIRKDFADSIESNIVHGSDGPDTAAFEISYFFNATEIFELKG